MYMHTVTNIHIHTQHIYTHVVTDISTYIPTYTHNTCPRTR